MARPNTSKYDQFLSDGGLSRIRILRMNGLKDYEIYGQLGISKKTFYRWKQEHPEFTEALNGGLNTAIDEAIKALQSKFHVITLTETKVEEWTDGDGSKKKHVTKTVREIAPDTTAIIFFLKSKAGWRDNAEIADTTAISKLDELLNQTQVFAEKEGEDATVLSETD